MSLFFFLPTAGINAVLDAGVGATVSQIDAVAPYDSTVAIRFNTDGTVETGKSANGDALSWSSAGTWIQPTSEASSDYEVRFTNLVVNTGSGDWTTEAAVDDAWVDLGTQRTWSNNRTTEQTSNFDCDFEVRAVAGGVPEGSDSYTFDIQNTA